MSARHIFASAAAASPGVAREAGGAPVDRDEAEAYQKHAEEVDRAQPFTEKRVAEQNGADRNENVTSIKLVAPATARMRKKST